MKEEITNKLADIAGKDYVSDRPEELYIYSRDPGAQKPRQVRLRCNAKISTGSTKDSFTGE